MGVEVTSKVLGLIGAGNIGTIVAARAQGLRMKVIAYDPFLTNERAVEIGVEKVELDDLLARADFISLHTPLTDETRNILSRERLAQARKGVRIVNCARGGLIDEGGVEGRARQWPYRRCGPRRVRHRAAASRPLAVRHAGLHLHAASRCLDHRSASQCRPTGGGANGRLPRERRRRQCAQHAIALGRGGAAPQTLHALAEKLGSLIGQLAHGDLPRISVELEGDAAELNPKPITAAVLAGLMRRFSQAVNMVNAPFLARERG
jgi:D-3-phosphoglycerate dehydrogenase